jgi:peptidoglycan/LPS O-acetylase OafA/YrhL
MSNVWIALRGWDLFGAIGHFWSLAVEEQFYLLWPFVILLFDRRPLIKVCLVLMNAALCVRIILRLSDLDEAAFVLTPARMDALAIGALLALVARGPGGLTQLAPFARPAAVTCGFAVALIFVANRGFDVSSFVVATVGHSWLACLFGSLLVIALTSTRERRVRKWLECRLFTFFGRYSYALYVFHHPILFFMPAFLSFASFPTLYGSQLPARLSYILLMTSISVLIAAVSWQIFEKPFLKLKRFFPLTSTDGLSKASI